MPSEIDSYTHIEDIHEGRTCKIHKAQDLQGRIVAVKSYNQSLDLGVIRDEIRKGFDLRKAYPDIPNDILVYPHIGEVPRVAYYYIEGQTAKEEAAKGDQNDVGQKIQKAKRLISGTMISLEELIKRKLAHRDIKGPNIIVHEDKPSTLLDYDYLTAVRDTELRSTFGSPFYFSPEQASYGLSSTMDVCSLAITAADLYMDRYTNTTSGIARPYDEDVGGTISARSRGFRVADPDVRNQLLNLDRFPEDVRKDVHGVICFLLEALHNYPEARPKTAEETRQLLEMTPNISMI